MSLSSFAHIVVVVVRFAVTIIHLYHCYRSHHCRSLVSLSSLFACVAAIIVHSHHCYYCRLLISLSLQSALVVPPLFTNIITIIIRSFSSWVYTRLQPSSLLVCHILVSMGLHYNCFGSPLPLSLFLLLPTMPLSIPSIFF